ncbi:MAG TPA: hypothetical protein VFI26_09235 [Lysobacter sp.]|jgi:hypothetical protein|nr:hypothetical protein [Lysobacter sp.]
MKCATADGATVYTDRACMPGSEAMAMPGQLLARIARDEAMHAGDVDAIDAGAVPVQARRSVAAGCARTPAQLQVDLRASIALGDVNRVAESYHWVGLSTREGERVLDRLQRMAREPVADAHYFNASISSSPLGADAVEIASAGAGPGPAGMLQLQLGRGAGVSVVDLDVERYAGCYFVKF